MIIFETSFEVSLIFKATGAIAKIGLSLTTVSKFSLPKLVKHTACDGPSGIQGRTFKAKYGRCGAVFSGQNNCLCLI